MSLGGPRREELELKINDLLDIHLPSEFSTSEFEKTQIYDETTLEWDIPENIIRKIKKILKEINTEPDYSKILIANLNYGNGPIFKSVEGKKILFLFKSIVSFSSIEIIFPVLAILIPTIIILPVWLSVKLFLITLLILWAYIEWLKPYILIKGEAIAHRIKGNEIKTDIFLQISGKFMGLLTYFDKKNKILKKIDEFINKIENNTSQIEDRSIKVDEILKNLTK